MPRALSTISVINYSAKKSRVTKSYTSQSKNRRVFRFSLFLSFLLLGVIILNLYLNLQLVEANFNLKEVAKKIEKTEAKTQNLESQIVSSHSIDKIKKAAKDLKLVEAKNVEFVKISKTGSLSLEK